MENFLSRQQVKVIIEQAPKGSDPGRIVQALADKGYKLEGFNDQPVQQKESTVSRVGTDINNRANNINDAITGQGEYQNKSVLNRSLGAAKEVVGSIPSVVTDVLPEPARNIINKIGEVTKQGFEAVTSKLADTQIFKDAVKGDTSKLEDVLGSVSATGDIAGSILAVEGGAKTLNTVGKGVTKATSAISDTVKNLTTQSEKQIESSVLKNYNKGVKPSIAGMKTPGAVESYKDNVLSAVDTIKKNSPNLSFTNDLGETITGETPKSLQQLSDSIEQTKKSIFSQYDSLAKQAGKAGVTVETTPIASELDSVINNKALALTNPKAIDYATSLKDRLQKVGNLDAMTAQEVIQNYNKSLEAFYRNPSYDNASQAAIDALIANKVRETLDKGISGLTGKEYGALKKQYGALKSIEKDVVKATIRDARKNTKGLIDFTDILSGGQVVNGILSLNPAQVASGITQKAISEFYKYLNNPNRAIEKMFK